MTELMGLQHQPSLRRSWLLHEAVRCAPLDRAIELARAAEAFLSGTDGAGGRRETQPTSEAMNGSDRIEAPASPLPESVPNKVPASPERTGLALSSEQRDLLLDRIAAGATNAQLAQEFGVSPRQVQGVRMGAAREIANRRDRRAERNVVAPSPEIAIASAEDIVRYLRQQDDIVVPQDGAFLVNGRFRLGVEELVARANRMRSRQGKPEFRLANGLASPVSRSGPTNGHPIFWKDPGPAPGPNSGSSI